jgi:hypothetical protein
MSGSFLPSLGRQPKSTRVEGADMVVQSCVDSTPKTLRSEVSCVSFRVTRFQK